MADKDHKIEINFLDHVAIRVADMEVSAAWYEKVLGLKQYKLPEWGAIPIFLLSGKSGIALFPANTTDTQLDPTSRNVKIDHFAFNIQDHHYFDSIYTKDPDGHTVELTTIKVNEREFYK